LGIFTDRKTVEKVMTTEPLKESTESIEIKFKNISPPFDPYKAMGYSFYISWIFSGIILGINWRRLGKPNWFIPTAIISFIIQALAITIAIIWIIGFRTVETMPKIFLYYIPSLMAGIIFAIPLAIAKIQNGPYKLYKKEGRSSLVEYKYDWIDTITYGILLSFGIGVIFLVAFTLFY
jgi:hypothetical protein